MSASIREIAMKAVPLNIYPIQGLLQKIPERAFAQLVLDWQDPFDISHKFSSPFLY
jgi:hypothetical protein